MGSNRRKRTKQCSESDISDIDESNQPPTTSTKDTSAQHFPLLILVESKAENKPITSLSPFVILKVIQSIAGEPENIKNHEGQLSVSGERMCTILVNRLEDKACPVNVWLGKLTALDMTPLG